MIIGLNGLKSSGKSTAADYLIASYGFVPVSFAQPLKDSVAALLGITLEEIEEWKNDPEARIIVQRPNGMRSSMDFRTFLQRYGTEAHRDIPEFGPCIWSDMADEKLQGPGNYVVADCRFVNECNVIHFNGGKVIRVLRDAAVTGDEHESEGALPPECIDAELDNNGRIEDLYDRLDLLMKGLIV
jgi:hypothetical protein